MQGPVESTIACFESPPGEQLERRIGCRSTARPCTERTDQSAIAGDQTWRGSLKRVVIVRGVAEQGIQTDVRPQIDSSGDRIAAGVSENVVAAERRTGSGCDVGRTSSGTEREDRSIDDRCGERAARERAALNRERRI